LLQTQNPIYDVTVVITNYNGGDRLLSTIRSLKAQRGVTVAVLVFDDGATDDSIKICEKSGLADSITISPANTKCANRWRTAGLKSAQTDLVLVTDNDLEFAPDCLFILAETLVKDPSIGAVTPAIYDIEDHTEPHSLGSLTHFLGLTIRLANPEAEIVDSVGAGITMFSKKRIAGLGFYDTRMPMGWGSDNEFHQRIRLAGLRSVVNRRAKIFHDFKPFSDARSYRVAGATHNRLRFMLTHYTFATLLGLLPLLILFEMFLMTYFGTKGLGWQYFEGLWLFLGNLKDTAQRRRFVQGLREKRDSEILSSGDVFIPPHARSASRVIRRLVEALNWALSVYWRTLTWLTRR
jgi:GT2 family glycosyltransferase